MLREQAYLNEMQIDGWELSHAERLTGYAPAPVSLSDTCSLLLVSPVLPQGENAVYLAKVLSSIKLSLGQAMHLYPHQFSMLDFSVHTPKWIWFASTTEGSASNNLIPESAQILSSPLLSEISGNTLYRRALWQQICSYESN